MQKQSLGDRMKRYENITRYSLSPKSFIIARIDGKAFHTFCRGLDKPFDEGFIEDMNHTAVELCKQIQNAKFAYVQSDEISILIHESEQDTDPWFDNTLQKMTSVAASIATAEFNNLRTVRFLKEYDAIPGKFQLSEILDTLERHKLANFDARFWTLPTLNEVVNYFLWRVRDCNKNSISAVAQTLYSHKQLEGKNSDDKQEMIFQKGYNWNDFSESLKNGRLVRKRQFINGEQNDSDEYEDTDVVRNKWIVESMPRINSPEIRQQFIEELFKYTTAGIVNI